MSRSLLCGLVLLAVLVQLAVLPAFVPGAAAPILPLALIAGWGAVRAASEVLPALPVIAVPMGIASEERVGWYLLACLPVIFVLSVTPQARTRAPRLAVAAAAAGGGGALYLGLLLLVAGRAGTLPDEAAGVALSSLATGGLGYLVGLSVWPWRAESRSLFG